MNTLAEILSSNTRTEFFRLLFGLNQKEYYLFFDNVIYDMIQNIDAISSERRVVMNAHIPYIKFKDLQVIR